MSGNSSVRLNVTALSERLSRLASSFDSLLSSPANSGFNLRVFNQSIWDGVFDRLGQDLNGTAQRYM
jgi:hypothetical protein